MLRILSLLLIFVFLFSCSHKELKKQPISQPVLETSEPAEEKEVEVPEPEVIKPVVETLSEDILSYGIDELNKMGYLKPIYFDFDKFDIKEEYKSALEENAYFLKQNPSLKVRIEGHCDERGTTEYNLALGEKRATSSKNYLISLGIEEDRIDTISFGKEKPLALCHNESCWWQNRRAHFVIVSK